MIECLTERFVTRGVPEHLFSDNAPEFTARAARHWLGAWGFERFASSEADRGGMAAMKVSVGSYETSYSIERYSIL